MAIKSIFQPFAKRPHMQDLSGGSWISIENVLRYNFSIYTWILLGASLQALVVFLVSSGRYVLLISTVLLFAKVSRTLLQAFNFAPNPYLEDVIPGRTTALVPDEDGNIATSGSEKIAVLHLGAKSNHPFGYLAPQFAGVGDWV